MTCNTQQLETFINREVIMLASHLVENLLEASMYGEKTFGGIELDNIENLYITEEATAQEYGYTSLEQMQEAGEDRQEIFEWWFVTQWLYERLRKAGEPVIDSDYGYLWGRTCTGQAISLDGIIQRIYAETRSGQEKGNENPLKNAVRFPKLKNKTLEDKISEYDQNWEKAEAAVKTGQAICLSDLMIQAEDIHLTTLTNTTRDGKKDQPNGL
jgi:hypothetical protein